MLVPMLDIMADSSFVNKFKALANVNKEAMIKDIIKDGNKKNVIK
jgi:hypothetical protein